MLVDQEVEETEAGSATEPKLICSVGVMAYNEEANIGQCLQALLNQEVHNCEIKEIVVVASGCTDNTVPIVEEICEANSKVSLLVQPRREGKASAINLFLRQLDSDIVILESADTVPEPKTIEHLVAPFIDPDIGMTGAHPVPVNDPGSLMGFAVHFQWELHHQVSLQLPKMGELVAFRRVFHRIPYKSAVDEANVEPLIVGQGYQLRYVPEAIVRNRGPETVSDFIKQRRRIYAGHLTICRKQGYAVSTMSYRRIFRALIRSWHWEWRYLLFAPLVICLEAYGRFLGWSDCRLKKRDHTVWDVASTTKGAVFDGNSSENPSLQSWSTVGLAQDAAPQPDGDSIASL